MLDWDKYPNFSKDEFDCSHTGENKMQAEFMDILQQIRTTIRLPLVISSGYRSPLHPIEARKSSPGEHTYGVAADILISGTAAMDLMVVAYGYGIRRFGIAQKGEFKNRFIHLGMGNKQLNFPEAVWSY